MDKVNELTCEKRSYSKEFTLHQHEFGQFLFPLQGSLDMEMAFQEVTLSPDQCFYLPPGLNHNYRSRDRNEFLILDIPTQYLPKGTNSMYMTLDSQWSAIRYLLLEEAKNPADYSALVDLTRYVTKKLQTSNPPSIDYIHQHFKEPLNLETLAAIEHYHPVYYSTWFKKQTGKSVKEYLSKLRLDEAKRLLLSTGWSMSRISEEVGFANSSSFTRWFVSHESVSPQKYRILNNR